MPTSDTPLHALHTFIHVDCKVKLFSFQYSFNILGMTSNHNPCKVYIGRELPTYIKAEQIYQHLRDNEFDDEDIVDIIVPTDAAGRSKGYAFVTFASQDLAKKALDTLNGTKISGRHKIELEPMTVPLKCPPLHHKYIDLMLSVGMPAKERKEFISSLPANITCKRGKIHFDGDQQNILKSQEKVRKRFLENLSHREFTFSCETEFIPEIIKKYILTHLRRSLQFVYQLSKQPDGKTRKQQDLKGGGLSIIIYSQNSDHFSEICEELKVSLHMY